MKTQMKQEILEQITKINEHVTKYSDNGAVWSLVLSSTLIHLVQIFTVGDFAKLVLKLEKSRAPA